MRKHRLWLFAPLLVLINPVPAESFQMVNTWSPTYRDDVKVRFCACHWDMSAPTGDPSSEMEGAIRDWLAIINLGLATDLNLVYDGKARKTGTNDPATPYNPLSNPFCYDEEISCQNGGPLVIGRLYIRAQYSTASTPGAGGFASVSSLAKNCHEYIDYAGVTIIHYPYSGFYTRINASETSHVCPLTSDWAPGTLMHELGHAIGWTKDHYNEFGYPWDIVEPMTGAELRTTWEHEFSTSRAMNQCFLTPYIGKPGRELKHFVTYNEGLSWTEVPDDGNLNATTNAKPGAAWGSTNIGNRYVLAWARPEDGHIVTIIGDGYSWSPNTRVVHTDNASRTRVGVSMAYGNGQWVMTWTGIGESASFPGNPIYYKVSFDGITWSEARLFEFSIPAVDGWGAIQTPVVRFSDFEGGRFVLMFQNWDTENAYDGTTGCNIIWDLSRVRQCVSESPFWYGFGNCTELTSGSYTSGTWVAPGMDCQPNTNECLITGAEREVWANGLHELWNHTAYFYWNGGDYIIMGDALGSLYVQPESSASNGWTTRQEISVLWSGSKWMMAANWEGELYSGTKSTSTPSQDWTQRTVITTDTSWTAPDLVYAEPWWTEVSAFVAVD